MPAQHGLELRFGEVGEAGVEIDRPALVLRGIEDRRPVLVGDAGQPHLVRLGDEQDAVVAQLRAALNLLDRLLHIPEWQRGQQHEPLRIGARELDQVIVVGPDALDLERGVLDRHERVVGEREQVRVQRLAVDAVLVHALQARSGLERARVGVVDRGRVLWRELVPACDGPVGYARQHAPADHPAVASEPFVEDDVRDVVTPSGHG